MLQLIIDAVQPLLVPFCFVSAWFLVLLVVWNTWAVARDSINTAKQMHQIPCADCSYFTDDYRLKCTIHPSIANTEEAIECLDYQAKTNPMLY